MPREWHRNTYDSDNPIWPCMQWAMNAGLAKGKGVPLHGRACLPVQRGCGLRMAGMGILPSQSSSHIRMFMKTSRAMKVSRLVISRQPSSVSCTMPITGLLPCKHRIYKNQDAEAESVALD